MKILNRYVLKEHVGPLAFALTALTSLMLLNYIAKQFGQLVGKGLGAGVILEFLMLSIPFTVAMTLPMAVLVSVLYAFSRLAAENEITALKASGVGMPRVLTPVLVGAAFVTVAAFFLQDQILPRANHRLRVLQGDIARKKPTFAIREQVINELSPGKLFLKAGHIDQSSNTMREVTIYDLSDPARRRTIYADSGTLNLSPNRRDLDLTLFHGTMQEISRSDPSQLQRLFYTQDFVRVKDVLNSLERSTNDSFKSDREMGVCELQGQVDAGQRDRDLARFDLAQALANAVDQATGGGVRSGRAPKPAFEPSIGHAYCALVRLVGVKTAVAATLDVARADAALMQPSRRARMPRTTPPPPPVVVAEGPMADPVVRSSIESARTRIVEGDRTMDSYDVEIQKKFAISTACMVFVLLGAPIALRFPRGGVGLVIGVSLGVFGLYYVGLIAGEALADKGILSPFWAMWAANILFTAIGAVLLARMGKEGNTARGGDMGEFWLVLRTKAAGLLRRVGVPINRRRIEVV